MGTQLPLPKGAQPPPIFGPCLLWSNGWLDQDATWYGGRRRPRRHCVRWLPSSPQRGTARNFRTMSIVAKRSPISAKFAAEHLFQNGAGRHFGFLNFEMLRDGRVKECQNASPSIGRTRVSIHTMYCSKFGACRLLRFRDIAGFVSHMPLLYITGRRHTTHERRHSPCSRVVKGPRTRVSKMPPMLNTARDYG